MNHPCVSIRGRPPFKSKDKCHVPVGGRSHVSLTFNTNAHDSPAAGSLPAGRAAAECLFAGTHRLLAHWLLAEPPQDGLFAVGYLKLSFPSEITMTAVCEAARPPCDRMVLLLSIMPSSAQAAWVSVAGPCRESPSRGTWIPFGRGPLRGSRKVVANASTGKQAHRTNPQVHSNPRDAPRKARTSLTSQDPLCCYNRAAGNEVINSYQKTATKNHNNHGVQVEALPAAVEIFEAGPPLPWCSELSAD